MTLTRTITQTHRHFRDNANTITVEEARAFGFPLFSECGTVWIPGVEEETAPLPMCPQCEAKARRSAGRDDRPHYVYRCMDEHGNLVYVGCSVSPKNRMDTHRSASWWYPQVASVRYIVFPSREYALAKEREAIAEENPRFNIKGRWSNRALWGASDYEDYYLAVTRTKAGSLKQKLHLESVAQEASLRYGVELVA